MNLLAKKPFLLITMHGKTAIKTIKVTIKKKEQAFCKIMSQFFLPILLISFVLFCLWSYVNCRSNGNKGRQLCRKLQADLPCSVQEMDLNVEKNVFLHFAGVQEATDWPTMYCAGDGPYCREECIFALGRCAGSYRLAYHVLCRRWTLL